MATIAEAQTISIDKITVAPGFNVRDMTTEENRTSLSTLTQSIKDNGLFTPLQGYYNEEGVFVLTRGHRRLEAMLSLDWKFLVPVILDNRAKTQQDLIAGLLLDNSGKALAPLEAAEVFLRLAGLKMTQDLIAKVTGVTPMTVSSGLAVLKVKSAVVAIKRGLTTHTEAYECIKALASRGDKPPQVETWFKNQVEAAKAFSRKNTETPAEPAALYYSPKARMDLLDIVANLSLSDDDNEKLENFTKGMNQFCEAYAFSPMEWYNAQIERSTILEEEAELKESAKEKRAEAKADKEAASKKSKEAKAKQKSDAQQAKAMRGNVVG